MRARYYKYILDFKIPSGTSRGILTQKETWFIIIEQDGKKGIGECGILRGLSADDRPDYEDKLQWTCTNIHLGFGELWNLLVEFPSIQMGIEMAFLSLQAMQISNNSFLLFPSNFTKRLENIPINGLVWMGDLDFMKKQIADKIESGFTCIKLKIGALNFDDELILLKEIREYYTVNDLEIRVDANGSFTYTESLNKLIKISEYQIHSIEQPITKNNTDKMAHLCKNTKLPIALDEELIGVFSFQAKENLLLKIKPQYIILKPSFIGGFKGTLQWIALAKKHKIGWWITSALESNIGLNAIAQFTYLQNVTMPQGLGTGSLYTNNFESPLTITNGSLQYNNAIPWKVTIQDNVIAN